MQDGDLSQRVRARINTLPPTMRRVARFMEQNRVEVVGRSAAELAAALQTSDATVVRTARALGYARLAELKRSLTKELSNGTPVKNFQRTVQSAGADTRRATLRSIEAAQSAAVSLSEPEMLDRIQRMIEMLAQSDRIVLFGIGPTAHLVGYAALQLRRLGRAVLVLDVTGRALADAMLELRPGDALLLMSYGRPYAEVLAVVEDALMQGLPIALITNTSDSPLAGKAHEVIALPRGGAHGMALGAPSFICVEAITVGLSLRAPEEADKRLRRLEQLRSSIDRLG